MRLADCGFVAREREGHHCIGVHIEEHRFVAQHHERLRRRTLRRHDDARVLGLRGEHAPLEIALAFGHAREVAAHRVGATAVARALRRGDRGGKRVLLCHIGVAHCEVARLGHAHEAPRRGRDCDQQRRGSDERARDESAVTPRELPRRQRDARRPDRDRLMRQMATHIGGELRDACVAPFAILVQTRHRDLVEVATQTPAKVANRRLPQLRTRRVVVRQHRARALRDRFVEDLHHGRKAAFAQRLRRERQRAGQQLVEDDAERVDVRARVDRHARSLLGAHVLRRAEQAAELRRARVVDVDRPLDRLREAEVDDVRQRLAGLLVDEHVARLEVAMHDTALMRVMDRAAHRDEQRHARVDRQSMLVAIGRQRQAVEVVHREERAAVLGAARFEDARDAGMIELRQHLALGLEALQQVLGRRRRRHDLERHATTHGFALLREVDDAEATAAQFAHDLVRPDACTARQRRRRRGLRVRADDGLHLADRGVRRAHRTHDRANRLLVLAMRSDERLDRSRRVAAAEKRLVDALLQRLGQRGRRITLRTHVRTVAALRRTSRSTLHEVTATGGVVTSPPLRRCDRQSFARAPGCA